MSKKLPPGQNLDAYMVVGNSTGANGKARGWPMEAFCHGDNVIVNLSLPPEPQAKPNAKVVIKVAPLLRRSSSFFICKCMQEDERMPLAEQFSLVF